MVFQSVQPYSTQRRKINDMIKKIFNFSKTFQGVSNNFSISQINALHADSEN